MRLSNVVTFLLLTIKLKLTFSQLLPNLTDVEYSAKLFDLLLNSTDYDSRMRPTPRGANESVEVRNSMYVYFLGNIDAQGMAFDVHFLIRQRWMDPRLRYSHLVSHNDFMLEGEDWFSQKIWTPNIYIENEVTSEVMSMNRDSVFLRITKSGEVNYNYRVRTTVLCDIELKRFPHDYQNCHMSLESWSFSDDDLTLKWEKPMDAAFDMHHFKQSEYDLRREDVSLIETTTSYKMYTPAPKMQDNFRVKSNRSINMNGMHKKVTGNYSTLQIKFQMKRYASQYIIDYYIPSALLVAMSWVSFWLEPSAIPGRTTLGTASWLTFINLNKNLNDQVSRVAYIKFVDVWFLACTFFIFASLLEFAFVNYIARSKASVTIARDGGMGILKEGLKELSRSAFTTPSLRRKNSDLNENGEYISSRNSMTGKTDEIWLAVENIEDDRKEESKGTPVNRSVPNGQKLSLTRILNRRSKSMNDVKLTIEKDERIEMTHQEIAYWVDRKARWIFPLLYLGFVIFYFVSILYGAMDHILKYV